MNNQKYRITITLKDDVKLVTYKEYNWNDYDKELNNPYIKFLQINNFTINKENIKTIVVDENPDYVETKKSEEVF